MQDRAMASDKISFVWNSTVDEVLGDHKVEGARLRNLQTGELSDISAGGIFVAIGHTPNSSLFQGKLELDPAGYIVAGKNLSTDWDPKSPYETRTSVEGVFAAGDVGDHTHRPAGTAPRTGCIGSSAAQRGLGSQGD